MKGNESVRIQTSILTEVKNRGEARAIELGFGSLTDVVRLFVTQFANGEIEIGKFGPYRDEYLSPSRIAEYEKEAEQALKDLAAGKIKSYGKDDLDEMMQDLVEGQDND